MDRERVHADAQTCKAGLTADRLRELLHYDQETGLFSWRVDRGNRRCKGQATATATDIGGYLMIRVDYVIYKAHRLAWFYMTGEWPPVYIDHINGVRADNRWANLRLADTAQNTINSVPRSNKTGFSGVARSSKNSFRASLKVKGKYIYLGNFATAGDAHNAFRAAAETYNGEFRKPSKPTPGEVRG